MHLYQILTLFFRILRGKTFLDKTSSVHSAIFTKPHFRLLQKIALGVFLKKTVSIHFVFIRKTKCINRAVVGRP